MKIEFEGKIVDIDPVFANRLLASGKGKKVGAKKGKPAKKVDADNKETEDPKG